MYRKKIYAIFYMIAMLIMSGCGNSNVSVDDKISKVEVFQTGDIENVLVGFTNQRIRDYNSLDILIGSLNISLVNTNSDATKDILKLTNLIEKLSTTNVDFSQNSLLLYVQDESIIQSYKEELIVRNPTMLDVPTAEIIFKYIGDSGESAMSRYILIYEVSNKITEVKLNLFNNEEVIVPW